MQELSIWSEQTQTGRSERFLLTNLILIHKSCIWLHPRALNLDHLPGGKNRTGIKCPIFIAHTIKHEKCTLYARLLTNLINFNYSGGQKLNQGGPFSCFLMALRIISKGLKLIWVGPAISLSCGEWGWRYRSGWLTLGQINLYTPLCSLDVLPGCRIHTVKWKRGDKCANIITNQALPVPKVSHGDMNFITRTNKNKSWRQPAFI